MGGVNFAVPGIFAIGKILGGVEGEGEEGMRSPNVTTKNPP